MKVVVTWAEEQPDPTTIAVRFHASDDGDKDHHKEHERAWQHFQARAYGVAAVPLLAITPVAVAAADEDRVIQPAPRTRLLSLPEAFYVLTADTEWLAAPASLGSHEQIWRRFRSASASDQRFQRHFIVQFHFRQLGWVLKSGLNYGAHYVLYRGAASEFHSEYIVYVKQQPQEQLSWGVVQALTRVAADVKKTVLVCDVACEELTSMGGVEHNVSDRTTSTLTESKYQFYGQEFHFTAVAMRFWDVSGSDSQAGGEQQSFAFQPQPVLLKKKKPNKKKAQDELLHEQTGGCPQHEPEVEKEARERTRELLLVRVHALVHEDDGERADVAIRVAQDGHEEHGPPVAREPVALDDADDDGDQQKATQHDDPDVLRREPEAMAHHEASHAVPDREDREQDERPPAALLQRGKVVRLDLRHERRPERQAAHEHERDQQLQVEHLLEHGPLGRRRAVHRSVALGVGPLALSLCVVIGDQQMRLLGQLDTFVQLRQHVLRAGVKVDQRRQHELVGGEHELREVPVEAADERAEPHAELEALLYAQRVLRHERDRGAVDERGGDRHGGRAAQHRDRIRALRGQEEVRRRDERKHHELAEEPADDAARVPGLAQQHHDEREERQVRVHERGRERELDVVVREEHLPVVHGLRERREREQVADAHEHEQEAREALFARLLLGQHDEPADAIFQRVAQALGGGGGRRGRVVAELRAQERRRLRQRGQHAVHCGGLCCGRMRNWRINDAMNA